MYSDVLHDKKITRVSVQTKQPKALVLGLWVTILSLANDSPERGKLLISDGIPLTLDEILQEAGLNGEGQNIIDEFARANMLSIEDETVIVTHWEDRQFASDHSRERVRQYRERQKGKHSDTVTEPPVTETEKKRYRNVTVTAQESESDKDILSKDNSGKPQVDSEKWNNVNKKIVGDKFLELTQLKPPANKKTAGTWWGWLYEIFEMAGKDAAETCRVMGIVVDYMRGRHTDITSPKSLINYSRVVTSGQELNGDGSRSNGPARASPKTPLTPEQQEIVNRLNESGRRQ